MREGDSARSKLAATGCSEGLSWTRALSWRQDFILLLQHAGFSKLKTRCHKGRDTARPKLAATGESPRAMHPYSTGSEGIGGREAWAAARLPTSREQIASR